MVSSQPFLFPSPFYGDGDENGAKDPVNEAASLGLSISERKNVTTMRDASLPRRLKILAGILSIALI